ncbi:MAG: hypothetical protein II699_05310, partial [Lachnospiraceae bacterium]|nr:hypothetical protein [Lachnospiraceae bacterium]
EVIKSIGRLENDIIGADKELKDKNDQKISLETEITNNQKIVTDLKGIKERLQVITTDYNRLNELYVKVETIKNTDIPLFENDNDIYSTKREESVKAFNECQIVQNEYDDLYAKYYASAVGIVLSDLKVGEPCPVCGSLDHPNPAKVCDAAVTEGELQEVKSRLNNAIALRDNLKVECESIRAKLEEKWKYLVDSVSTLISSPDINLSVEEFKLVTVKDVIVQADDILVDKINALKGTITETDKKCKEYESAEQTIADITDTKLPELTRIIDKLNEQKSTLNAFLSEQKGVLSAIGELRYKSYEDAVKAKNETINKYNAIKTNAEEKQNAFNDAVSDYKTNKGKLDALVSEQEGNKAKRDECKLKLDNLISDNGFSSCEAMLELLVDEEEIKNSETEISTYKSDVKSTMDQINLLKEQTKDIVRTDISEMKVNQDLLGLQVDDKAGQLNTVKNRISNNEEKLVNINAKKADYDIYVKQHNYCRNLYNLVSGNTGKGKLSLEQYLLAEGFDNIINAANRRLYPMTDNRYILKRIGKIGKQSSEFLDLEVLDNYTGKSRPVGNLSGGESFKASLSLALGLSDTVSSSVGGVQMDALFVDEGFGTLDTDSINSALDVLLNLSEGNKLVGLISHREELISSIPTRINVKKTREGSDIIIEED